MGEGFAKRRMRSRNEWGARETGDAFTKRVHLCYSAHKKKIAESALKSATGTTSTSQFFL